jgi:hypothetical protein
MQKGGTNCTSFFYFLAFQQFVHFLQKIWGNPIKPRYNFNISSCTETFYFSSFFILFQEKLVFCFYNNKYSMFVL